MSVGCDGCINGEDFSLPFSMAFQPIVDIETGAVFAHEALVRGIQGEGAQSILAAVDQSNRYTFDRQCRVKAIELAKRLNLADDGARLSINFMPNAVYEPRACIRATLQAAMTTGFPLDRIIFEFTEDERLDHNHVVNILRTYRSMGFMTAIDDFGAGHAGLSLLAHFQPDIVKLDMGLIRGVDTDPIRRAILDHTVRLLREINIMPICEGIETVGELAAIRDAGVGLVQGFLLAKPSFEALATPVSPQVLLADRTDWDRTAQRSLASN